MTADSSHYEDQIKLRDKQIETLTIALEDANKKVKSLLDEENNYKDKIYSLTELQEKKNNASFSNDPKVELELSQIKDKIDSKEKYLNNLSAIANSMIKDINISKDINKEELLEDKNKKDSEKEENVKELKEEICNEDNCKYKKKVTELEEKIEEINRNNEEQMKQTLLTASVEKTSLEEKVMKMKQSVLDIKAKLDTEIYKKFESKDKIIKECKIRLELSDKKIESLNKEFFRLKKSEEHSKSVRVKYNECLKEKMELEELIVQQEESINELNHLLGINEELLKTKSNELRNSEQSCISLMKLIDEQKKNIKQLQIRLKKKDEEEGQKKLLYTEKDQEIHFLKNFINSLKSENLLKEQSLSQLKNKLEKMKLDNKQLNNLIQSVEVNKKKLKNFEKLNLSGIKNRQSSENIFSYNNSNGNNNSNAKQNLQNSNNNSIGEMDVNEINDENLKEIKVLMKRILDG